MFTVNNKDTRTTALTLLILNIVSILNIKQFSHLILMLKLLTLKRMKRMISQIKPLKIKSFLSFNFAITKICGAIYLADDKTRMDGIQFRLSPSTVYPCNICHVNVNNKDFVAHCDIYQFWVYMKCNKFNHID